jgi:hypothetical protein
VPWACTVLPCLAQKLKHLSVRRGRRAAREYATLERNVQCAGIIGFDFQEKYAEFNEWYDGRSAVHGRYVHVLCR